MTLTDPRAYGHSFSETYDAWYSTVTDAEATARFVAKRCPTGTVLELGVGTGRLATALIDQGLQVVGLDASPDMLRRCPGTVHRVTADMSRPPLRPGLDATALCGFNTLFNLASEQSQQLLFRQIRPLATVLILETMDLGAPDPAATTESQVGIKQPMEGGVIVTATSQDHSRQTVVGRHLEISDAGVVARPWILRWTTVEQLDAMAGAAGFDLSERFSSWQESDTAGNDPAGNDPVVAISVYR